MKIEYEFILPAQQPLSIGMIWQNDRYVLQNPVSEGEDWARMSCAQCSHCPYQDPATSPEFCPVALNLQALLPHFGHLLSFDKLDVCIRMPNRTLRQEASVQQALCALLGLLFASSGCPHTEFLLPMARFHAPFASAEETTWRACGSFLLGQYLRSRAGLPAEPLTRLIDHYTALETVNSAMAKRLRSQTSHDAMVNAVVILDSFAKGIPFYIEQELKNLQELYSGYLP